MLLLTGAVLFIACVAGAVRGMQGGQGRKKNAAAERGKAVYLDNCARCHGADGLGQTTIGKLVEAPDLTDAGWRAKRTNARMIASVTRGRGQMPSFGEKLTRSQIAAAIAYVRTLKRTTAPPESSSLPRP